MKWWLIYNAIGQLTCCAYSAITDNWTPTLSWALGFISGFFGARISSEISRRMKCQQESKN
jgi:hypothetical protein